MVGWLEGKRRDWNFKKGLTKNVAITRGFI